ncbi:TauD/TfdA family dioxygenase [Aneurinibacillus sp. Ricciae_BoGa-3]|uniref:TauD/TfdA family dioxygenase n=1 Tax=Aneurinibacillus sp. Ricciae_BoGa-3 TaxID=3022697 RepID=UPI00233FFA9E|nr:TauD/TfdA family dioxygenase [Aneurinibacillus sp. Ricciae_BoGa-3]WCK56609.1 TauD/TfdA family dioxygenase [Aneurinibacillus sp. Ricciae_BoGa-3]
MNLTIKDGEDIKELQESIIVLTEEEKAGVGFIISQLPPLDMQSIDDDLLLLIQLTGQQLPKRLVEALLRFRRKPNPYGVLLFRNLPTDSMLPPTPMDGRFSAAKNSFYSEYCLLLFMLYLGDPISYEDEKEGLLIQNICPVQGHENRQENTSSNFLNFHTEDGFHPYPPDYLTLIGLRPDHKKVAKTLTTSIRTALHHLPSTCISLLRQPLYRLRPSSSFKINKEGDYSVQMPILSGHFLEPDICIHFKSMEAETVDARWALDTLKNALIKNIVAFNILPGDMLIMDNRMVAHARMPFAPNFDGCDRWLQRLFTIVDFRRSSFSRGQRKHICSPLTVEYTKQVK